MSTGIHNPSEKQSQNGEKLDWMYKGPGGHVSREEYLLGRKVDASLDLLNREENKELDQKPKSSHVIEYEIVPDSIARRRPEDGDPSAVVVQVDMKRKLLEDPLLAIRKNEELTRREITDNPVKRKQLQLLIQSIREESSSSSSSDSDSNPDRSKKRRKSSHKKKSKKKQKKHKKQKKQSNKHKKKSKKRQVSSSSSSSNSDSDSDSDSPIKTKKSKKGKESASQSSETKKLTDSPNRIRHKSSNHGKNISPTRGGRDRSPTRGGRDRSPIRGGRDRSPIRGGRDRSPIRGGRDRSPIRGGRDRSPIRGGRDRSPIRGGRDRSPNSFQSIGRDDLGSKRDNRKRTRSPSPDVRRGSGASRGQTISDQHQNGGGKGFVVSHREDGSDQARKRTKPTEEEMERKRQAMMQSAVQRDEQRKQKVEQYDRERQQELLEERTGDDFLKRHLASASASSTVEDRVKSRCSARQRGPDAMSQNFARK